MNYWKRHIGDYAKDAGHLSLLEHGVYTVLLDRLYGSEKPIPREETYRVTRATTKPEREAVDRVLTEFFLLQDEGWTHSRVLKELGHADEVADKNRANGKKGGRPPKKGDDDPTRPCPHQEIIALYHEVLPELPAVRVWTDTNESDLRVRWRQSEKVQSLDWWRKFFEHVKKSSFLTGKKTEFQASLGWLVKASNFAKVINGNYDDRGQA